MSSCAYLSSWNLLRLISFLNLNLFTLVLCSWDRHPLQLDAQAYQVLIEGAVRNRVSYVVILWLSGSSIGPIAVDAGRHRQQCVRISYRGAFSPWECHPPPYRTHSLQKRTLFDP